MRIGIDGGCLANRRGFGRFAREIIGALAAARSPHQFVVFLDRPSLDRVTIPHGMETVVVDVRVAPSVAASAAGRRSLGDMLAMGRAVARSHLDAIYFPASYSFFPVWNAGRVVVTMHDTLALAHPEWVFPDGRGQLAWRLKEQAAARWADRIVTVSEAARRDLAAWFRLAPDRIRVITEGPDATFGPSGDQAATAAILQRYGVDPQTRFLLYVGGLSPHKNLGRLIAAFDQATTATDPCHLILVGDFADNFHTEVPTLRAQIERLGRTASINLVGFVPDADLAHFYRAAYALVQPSLMEGFGLPPVEAMVSGTPVVCSRAGSLPEVVGPAGIFFDPFDTAAIAQSLQGILNQPAKRDRLAQLAIAQASRFTWDRAARLLLAVFDEWAAGQPGQLTRRRPPTIGRAPTPAARPTDPARQN